MKMLIPAFAALLAASPAFATAPSGETTGACTPDEANRLAAQVAERINDIIANDPDRAAQINAELRDMQLHRTAETLETECKAYRERLEEIERARKGADLQPADQIYRR